jgi:hypothetical protein
MNNDRTNFVFRELETQNPAVARSFRMFRQHAQPPTSPTDTEANYIESLQFSLSGIELEQNALYRKSYLWSTIAFLLVVAGLVALGITLGPPVLSFISKHWKEIVLPVGCACLGSGGVLFVSRHGATPLRDITPPEEDAEDPLNELNDLAERTASRLRSAYRFQLSAVVIIGVVFMGLIIWSAFMVSKEKILYASAFGSGSVAMAILTQWKWQPFDRINQARRLTDNADTLATVLRLRMQTISEIQDSKERAKAQWEAVEQYLKWS